MEEVKPKFVGKVMNLGGRDFVIPALSVRQGMDLWPALMAAESEITVANLPDKWKELMPIVTAAIQRNYPELKEDELMDLIDLRTLREIVMVVAGQSGIQAVPGPAPVAGGQ